MRHDPALQEAFDANRRAIALSLVPETAVRNFEAMPVHERRHRHEVATLEAIRQDVLAKKPNADAAYHARLADQSRKTAAALKAVGL